MEDFFKCIMQNTWFQVGAYIVGFTGTVIGFYSLRKKRIKPVYIMRSTGLLQESISNLDGLKIEFDNHRIGNLTVTNVAIWNAGKKTLHQSDVSSNEKISIKPKNGILVYRYSVLKESNPSNGVNLKTSKDNSAVVEIDFEYLDNNEGIAIQLIHSGKSSIDIEVLGSIKGFGRIKSNEGEFKTEVMTNILESPIGKLRPNKEDKKWIFILMVIVSFILLGTALFTPPLVMSILLSIHGMIYLMLGFTFRSVTQIPKEFEFIEQ